MSEAQAERGSGVTIAGRNGVGKTTLGALFPDPFFIRLEEGLKAIEHMENVIVTPKIKKIEEVLDWLERLRKEKHDRKACIFDSISAMDAMGEHEIVVKDGATNLNSACGGFGAGGRILARKMTEIRERASLLQEERGMHVVFLAHSQVETLRPQDSEPYDVLDLKMNPKSRGPFTEDVDVVAFLRLKTDTEQAGKDRRIAVSSGRREIVCYAHAALSAKNRLGIQDILRCPPGTNPLLEAIEARSSKPKTEAFVEPEREKEPEPEAAPAEEKKEELRDWM